uniref:Protein EARLY FLOWERING 3 n=1 Tax=Noccaea caerulescens TaxID=107243 RepID=A0A1J3EWR0_NOCCA
MKRGNDEEKILEPMFPRLHVNDADKGGPRAPPRNKMALYEQLSIPSQRFSSDHGTLTHNSRSNTTTLVPPGSSSQPCGVERNLATQHLDSAAAVQSTEKFVSQMSFMENVRSIQQHGQRKTVREEDDFAVPVFINSRRFQSHGRAKSGIEKEKHTSFVRDQVKGNTKTGGSVDLSAREEMDLEKSPSSCDRVNDRNVSLRQESRNRSDRDSGETRVMDTDNGVESHLATESHSEEGHGSPNDVDNGPEYCGSRGFASMQQINEEASDDVSDDSIVDSMSSVDVSPDDVVGVLGQKRFWRARKAIANQQRVFAVQLFELHRLIKVQRLIAASPDVLLDDISYLGKVAAKSYPVKKLIPSEFMLKPPLPQVVKYRSHSEKIDQHKMEHSAENIVGKLPNQVHHQPSNYNMPPYMSNPPASQTVNGCYFPPQPPPPSGGNQQWLIPVMSPSEGLIYKPHPGMGHTGPRGPVYGGYYGHFMPSPIVMGSCMGGGGQPQFQQGGGFPSPGNGYFPQYGVMPTMMNPYGSSQQQQQQQQQQQMNQFVHSRNQHNASALNTQQQSSVNEATALQQPTKPYPRVRKSRQGSTGSSPSGPEGMISGTKSFRPFSAVDEDNNDAPEQMMTTTTTTTRTTVTQTTRDGGGVTRVIKVVPHNAKLASENAARIFRSIQEERKNYDAYSNS